MLQCVPALGHFSQRDLRRPLLPCHLPPWMGTMMCGRHGCDRAHFTTHYSWGCFDTACSSAFTNPLWLTRGEMSPVLSQLFCCRGPSTLTHVTLAFSLSCRAVINLSASPTVSCYSKWFPAPCSLPRTLFSLWSRNHSHSTHMHFFWSLTVWLRSDMLFFDMTGAIWILWTHLELEKTDLICLSMFCFSPPVFHFRCECE